MVRFSTTATFLLLQALAMVFMLRVVWGVARGTSEVPARASRF